jgi:hypothetical protein
VGVLSSENIRPIVDNGRWMVRRRPVTAAFSSDSESLLPSLLRRDLDRCGTSRLARGEGSLDLDADDEDGGTTNDDGIWGGGVGG